MKKKQLIPIVLGSALALVFASSCKRTGVTEPNDPHPASFSILLKVTASQNTIFAGESRSSTQITANLKTYDGLPLSGKTLFFEILTAAGTKSNWGYFEGNVSTAQKVTDGGGNVYLNYFGPSAQELEYGTEGIEANVTVYIRASAALDDNNFVADHAQVDVVADPSVITFQVRATPDVLFVSKGNPKALIEATAKFGNKAWANRKVFFEIQAPLMGGFLQGNKTSTFAVTNGQGVAKISYYGPAKSQIAGSHVEETIQAQLETYTQAPPETRILRQVQIRTIKEK